MPWDGSGNYSPPAAPTFPAVSGQTISSSYYNAVINDLVAAIGNCLTKDNQNKPSADYDFNAKNLTNVAAFGATGNATIGGTLGVTGAATLSAALSVGTTLTVTGATTLSSTLAVTGNTTVGGTLGVTGATTLAGALAANGGIVGVSGDATVGFYKPSGTLVDVNFGTGDTFRFDQDLNRYDFYIGAAGPYFTVTSSASYVGGQVVWNAGNDGAGSGLDADLLDGQQGSAYANLTANNVFTGSGTFTGSLALRGTSTNFEHYMSDGVTRKGYFWHNGTNANITNEVSGGSIQLVTSGGGGFTFNSNTVWHSGNDGAGSGLDADLLDGQQGSAYALLAGASQSFTGVNSFSGFRATDNVVAASGVGLELAYVDPSSYIRSYDRTASAWKSFNISASSIELNAVGGTVTAGGNTMWTAGNDGSGSGLDADLLDGQQGSAYATIASANQFTQPQSVVDTANTPIATRTAGASGFEVKNTGGGAAVISFHRNAIYAGFLGIDTDNILKVGGWSYGTASHTIWHSGNDGSGSGLDADTLDGSQGALYLRGSRTSQVVTDGTAAPTGGSDGDIYFQYT